MAELKPCPFCGGEADHEQTMDESLWSHETVPYRRVRCRQCEIGTDYVCEGYEPTEVEQWNRRATDVQRDTAQGEPICVECNGSGEGVADTTCLRCNGQGGFPPGRALTDEDIRKKWTTVLGYSITDAELCVVRQLAAAPTPPDGDAERKRADAFVREFEDWVKQTGALPWGGSWMADVSSIIERAAVAASKGEKA